MLLSLIYLARVSFLGVSFPTTHSFIYLILNNPFTYLIQYSSLAFPLFFLTQPSPTQAVLPQERDITLNI